MPLRSVISEREEELPKGELGELIKIAVEEKDVISFGPGEPDFTPPRHVITAVKKAVEKGYTHYSPPPGRIELLKEVAKKLKRENFIDVKTEEIIITTGSTEAILLSLICVVDPGESVLVPNPGFVAYLPTVELLNGNPISIPLSKENRFQIDTDEIKRLVKPKRTRAIIINTPSNPTGTVFNKKTLEGIADVAVDNDLLIISDEAYEKFVYKGKHISIGSLNGMKDYVLTLHSFSKTHGMAGFRVGYAAGPEKIIKAMRGLHIYTTISAPTVSQMAAIAALKGSQFHVRKNVKEYNRRRRFVVKRINEIKGFDCLEPEGAFYAFPKIGFKMSSLKFCKWLLKNAKVAVVPGSDFGRYGEGFVRFSYATSYDKIVKGMNRIESAVSKLR